MVEAVNPTSGRASEVIIIYPHRSLRFAFTEPNYAADILSTECPRELMLVPESERYYGTNCADCNGHVSQVLFARPPATTFPNARHPTSTGKQIILGYQAATVRAEDIVTRELYARRNNAYGRTGIVRKYTITTSLTFMVEQCHRGYPPPRPCCHR